MKTDKLTDNGFIISNDIYKVECHFIDNSVSILKNGELDHYCKLAFPHPWNISNILQIIDVGSKELLFEVDLVGIDFNEWVNQLMKAFSNYLKDDLIIKNYIISGYTIPLIL